VHLLSQLSQVNVWKFPDVHEGFASNCEFFSQQSLCAESAPVLDSHADASELVGHRVVFLLEEAVESQRLRDVDSVHSCVGEAEELAALEADDLARQLLLTGRHFTGFDVKSVCGRVSEHLVHFEVPGCRDHFHFLEQKLLRLDVVHEQRLMLINNSNLLFIS